MVNNGHKSILSNSAGPCLQIQNLNFMFKIFQISQKAHDNPKMIDAKLYDMYF